MSDDGPLEPVTPAGITDPTDTNPTAEPVATDAPPAAPTAATPTVGAPSTSPDAATTPPGPPPWGPPPGGGDVTPPAKSSTVAVPKWLVLALAAIVFAGIGFGIGYAVAPGGDGDAGAPARSLVPSPFDRDGSDRLPTIPMPDQLRGAFLGVVTERSTDPAGVRIVRIVDDSPAAGAGLETGDVITEVDDESITTPAGLAEEIRSNDDGDEVTITYVRDGETRTAEVELTSRAQQFGTPPTTMPRQ